MQISERIEKSRGKFGKVYSPLKYFKGLKTQREVDQRYKRILEGSKSKTNDQKSYRKFVTDKGKKVRASKYTSTFGKEFPNAKSLKQKSIATGIPLSIIKEVYNKGMAAWRTGHRPGASQQAWGYARVHSFLMKGCTFYTADKYLVPIALKQMTKTNANKWLKRGSMCPKHK